METVTKTPTPFVILFQGRSGSTYLAEALDSHPDIDCDGERLVPLRKQGSQAQLDWTAEFLGGSEAKDASAVGFKTKIDDMLDREAMADVMHRANAKVIHLQRRNLVKVVVSWFNCERVFAATGDWNIYPPQEALGPFAIDPEKFQRRLGLAIQGRARLNDYVAGLGLRTHSVVYEDLLVDGAKVLVDCCDFLGVEAVALYGRCRKATVDNLRQVIKNFNALYDIYCGTEFDSMFHEVLVNAELPR